jgi:methylthioribulose-1-phosphate dehydratase
MDNVEAIDRILQIGRDFYRRGWVLGTSGNFSAVLQKSPLRVAITASSAHKGALTTEQILHIDGSGMPLAAESARPSAETLLHLAIMNQADANAVLHTHSVYGTLLSAWGLLAGGIAIEGFEMLKGLSGITTHEHCEWLPVLNNSQDMTRLADEVTALLRGHPSTHAFLINRHGLYTWGRSLDEAVRHVEILEFLMEVIWRSFEFQNTAARSATDVK